MEQEVREQLKNGHPETTTGDGSGKTAPSVMEQSIAEPASPRKTLFCDPQDALPQIESILCEIQQERKRPLFVLVSRSVTDDICAEVYRWRSELRKLRKDRQLDVLIDSPGGSLSACYQTARLFARYVDEWDALVPSMAASGATLICLGSSTIVLSNIAYLSPIDPQVISKRHEKFFETERQSPLEAFQAVRYLRQFTIETLDASMLFLLERGVASRPALDTALKLAVEITRPILEKIQPYDLGSFALDSTLAKDYCRRISVPANTAKKAQRAADFAALVESYPAHEFIIDSDEASSLGLKVAEPTEELREMFDRLRQELQQVDTCVGLAAPPGEVSGEEAAI